MTSARSRLAHRRIARLSVRASSSSSWSVRPAVICATCAGKRSSTSESDPTRRLSGRLRAQGLLADKRLGQHFLFDPSILRRIAAAAGDLGSALVLEIGPGPGGLTQALLALGAERVIAVERDPRFVHHLRELEARSEARLQVVEADALEFDPCTVADGRRLRIVANLPYNVATPMLFGWFDRLACIELMVLMFQKEVALRLVARPRTAHFGRLAVMAQLLCEVERVFDLPPAAFTPPPKVSSSVVRLTPRVAQPSRELRATLADLTRAAFGQRRKMLRSSLRSFAADPTALLAEAGIEPTRRAEELDVGQFHRLAMLHLALSPEPPVR